MERFLSILVLVIAAIILVAEAQQLPSSPVIQIPQGLLRGSHGVSRSGKSFWKFLGIPYANAPKRFQPSTEAKRWTGVRNATEDTLVNKCLQFNLLDMTVEGVEDCLSASVFTPKIVGQRATELLPVMVFIHGEGRFFYGSSVDYKPEYLMNEDIVLVTFEYRLGPLGFLSTGDQYISGNNGLKDQVTLLKWVKKNIEFFGGDPNSVTIFGQGAGGVSVNLHMLSPMSKGLFHRAISQSGNALCPWAINQDPHVTAMELAKAMDCPTETSKAIAKCLEKKDLYEMVALLPAIYKWFLDPIAPYAAVVEKNSKEAFLSEYPEKAYENPASKVPFIVGFNKEDGALLHAETILSNPSYLSQLNKEWNKFAPITFTYQPNDATSSAVRKHYFGTDGLISRNTESELSQMYTDRNFASCTKKAAKLNSKFASTFPYVFSYRGESSFLNLYGVNNTNYVSFADDLQYLFQTDIEEPIVQNTPSDKMISIMTKMWVYFAKTGRTPRDWIVLDKSKIGPLKWFEINDNPSMIEETFSSGADFWNDLPIKEAKRPEESLFDEEIDKELSNLDLSSLPDLIRAVRQSFTEEAEVDKDDGDKDSKDAKRPGRQSDSDFSDLISNTPFTNNPTIARITGLFSGLFGGAGSSSTKSDDAPMGSIFSQVLAKIRYTFRFWVNLIRQAFQFIQTRRANRNKSS